MNTLPDIGDGYTGGLDRMDSIKRMIMVLVPTGKCNFKCPYCYISQLDSWEDEMHAFSRSPEEIGKAFALERLGGPCFINFCAKGETLIYPQMVPVIAQLLAQGHYVTVVTNGSLKERIQALSELPSQLLTRLSMKFSFHYLELKRLQMMDVFIENVKRMRNAGASIMVELMPVDEEEEHIEDIKRICLEHFGALCHTTIARDDSLPSIPILSKHTLEEYCKIWSVFESPMLTFKQKVFNQKRNEFCYAGDWSIYVNLFTGELSKCYGALPHGNIYNTDIPIKFEAIGICQVAHCFNAHAFLSFGIIPELDTPDYAHIRNRVCADGSQWLSPQVKAFFESKLKESNTLYTKEQKQEILQKTRREMKIKQRKLAVRSILHPVIKAIPPQLKTKLKQALIKSEY